MRTSVKGLIEIASHEGIVAMPYLDVKDIWTFGIGHTAAAGRPDPAIMPRGVAQSMNRVFDVFATDVAKFERRVNRLVKVPLKQHEFDALVSFDYNTGGLHKANLLKKLNAGDRAGAARGFMGWKKPASIIPRRQKEQALFRDGTYSSDGYAAVYTADEQGWLGKPKTTNVARLLPGSLTEPPASAPEPVPPAAPPPDLPFLPNRRQRPP